MMKSSPTRRVKSSEEGYMLVAVIFMVALLTIALAIALPKVSKEIQRDRELETMHRGKQYIRGVRMYYKKFGAYPPNVDVLVKGVNNIRFLRKKYADPTTGKADWKPVRFGQNKAPLSMGFFGQPIGGAAGCSSTPASGSSFSSSSSNFSTSSTSFSGSANCAGQNTGSDTSTTAGGTNSTDPNASSASTSASGSDTSSTTGLGGQTGMTFGGGGIIGFSPNSPKQSIIVYKKKNHYNEWEFVYDPLAEQMATQGGANPINTQVQTTGTPGFNSSTTPTSTTPTPSTPQ
jgi:type II secretory pathway pseudopilin PulG